MKKILFFLTISISLVSFAQTFSIPDSNFEQALIDLNLDRTSPTNEIDGVMDASFASSITNLDLSNKNISDLTGISNFTSVEWLFLNGNNLTEVDLSNNLALIRLFITGNSLTSLDLSMLSNLERLGCGSNPITSLILPTTNSSLNQLECPIGNLSTLDLSSSLVLENIKINNNNLVSLDFSANTLLKDIDARSNKLSSVNLDNCNVLEEINFRSNELTNLIIEDKPELRYIVLEFNNLSSLTVKNVKSSAWNFSFNATSNPNLTCISVTDPTESANEWGVDSQVSFSTQCSSGATINIPDTNFEQALIDKGIDSDGVVNGQVLESDIINIETLDVSSKSISDLTGIEGFKNLETLFAQNNNLTTVDLSANTALSGLLIALNNLSSLDLSANVNLISLSANFNNLSGINLSNNLLLEQVYINNNQLTSIDVSMLLNLKELDVAVNNLVELNLENNPLLNIIFCQNNNLANLNLQNGNNANVTNTNFNATSNENLFCIQVDDVNFSTTTTWNNIDTQSFFGLDCAPSNDGCADATPLTLGAIFNGSNISATSSNVTPGCQQGDLVIIDVWFEFDAPDSASVFIAASSLEGTVKFAIYENCNSITPIACSANDLLQNNLTVGQKYYLQVWIEADLAGGKISQTKPVKTLKQQPGNFTINVQDASLLSTSEVEISKMKLYPNPASNEVTITSPSEIKNISVYNVLGEQVYLEDNSNSTSSKININHLSKGMYIVRVKALNGIQTERLIIK